MRLLFPIAATLLGGGAGIATAVLTDTTAALPEESSSDVPPELATKRLDNQFVLPLFDADGLRGHVVLSLALLVRIDPVDVHDHEPRLRDAFLTELARHAEAGGFDENPMHPETLDILRSRLLDGGRRVLGEDLESVLIGGLAISAGG